MDAQDIVIDSAASSAEMVATEGFAKLTKHALRLTGSEIARHVASTDRRGLLAPVELVKDGKRLLGAILALEDRAIVAWTTGTLRVKNFETVVPYGSIESIEVGTRPGGAMSKARETLRIKADGQVWDLVFANVFEGGTSIVPFIAGMLDGAIKPVYESM
jgi:hypothetical protein